MTKVQREIDKTCTGGGIQPNRKPKKQEINVAEALKNFADNNSGAVGKSGFTELLKMFNKTNIVAQLKDYNKNFPNNSIIAIILGETMSNKADQKEALVGEGEGKKQIIGIYTLLLERARELGVDEKTLAIYKQDFTTELDKQLDKFMSSVCFDSTRLDNLMNALIQTIDNYQAGNTAPDKQVTLKGSGATVSKTQTNAYNMAFYRFNTAKKDFNAQMKNDGWTGDIADAFGRIYGSDNVASKVRADLDACNKQLVELKAALEEGNAAFSAKFKEIFGIPYNARNIQAYQEIEKTYLAAAKEKEKEDAFKAQFSLLLNGKPLAEEGQVMTLSVSAGTTTYVTTATKADVYKREFDNMAILMGENGADQLNALINELVGADASIEKKYEILQKLAKETLKNFHEATTKACGGRNFDSVQKQYDNSYKAAYGVENDIMKRVTDYNISQQKGAGIVKGIGTALLTAVGTIVAVGSAGTLTPAVAATVAGVAAAAPAVVEVSDRATSGKALDSLRNEGVSAWLKTTNEETDWDSVAKTSLTNGALSVVFMGQSYAVTGLCMKAGLSATATGAANAAGIAATGIGTEYLMTGEISVEGAIFTVAMAVVGGVMTVKSIKAASVAESQARAEQHATDVQTSRQTLGFEDGVEITPEGLKAQYKKLSLQNHPDRGGNATRMADINNAYDFLSKNLADLNIATPKTSVVAASAKAPAEPTAAKAAYQAEAKATKLAQTTATLEKAGFNNDIINQMIKETGGTYSNLVPATLNMVEYLEGQLAKGVKLTPSLINKAIQECDGIYSQAGYGSAFQEQQKELLGKFWNKADDLKAAYQAEGKFLTQAEAQADDLQKQIEPEFNQWLKDSATKTVSKVSSDEIAAFSAELEAIYPGDPENIYWINAYGESPQVTKWLARTTEREIDGNTCLSIARNVDNDDVELVARLVDLKSPREIEHHDGFMVRDNYALDLKVIPEILKFEKQYPGIIQQMLNEPKLFRFDFNKHSSIGANYELPLIAEAYQKNPQLVCDILSTIDNNSLYLVEMPEEIICKLGVDNPDGIMNFVKDKRNYNNIDWYEMFRDYYNPESRDNAMADLVNLYNKNPENFHALAGSDTKFKYSNTYNLKYSVEFYETNPKLAEYTRNYILRQSDVRNVHYGLADYHGQIPKPSAAVDFLMEHNASPSQIYTIAPMVGDNIENLSKLVELRYDFQDISTMLEFYGDSPVLQLYTSGGMRYTGGVNCALIDQGNRINEMLEIVKQVPNIDENQLVQILELKE